LDGGHSGDEKQPAAHRVIGGTIRKLRARDGLTQGQLAAGAGISYQYLCGIESGRQNFSICILERIARALDLSLGLLVAVAYGESSAIGFARALARNPIQVAVESAE
jgi:transcriptional regulator with XRE-family HTH domain